MATQLTFEAYCDWHSENFAENLRGDELSAKFNANTVNLQNTVNAHPFMGQLSTRLTEKANEGVFEHSGKTPDIVLYRKPFQSFADKIFRLNCLWNRAWPDEPNGGWITYLNSFSRIDDIIRTTLICKYLDGPEIIANQIIEAANASGLKARTAARATDSGYYAWHTYVSVPAKIIVADTVIDVNILSEFQTTTLLQSSLRELTHKFYEESRQIPNTNRAMNRWDYSTHKFKSEYLGHTLHLVDAMILELRNAQRPNQTDAAPTTRLDGQQESEISQ